MPSKTTKQANPMRAVAAGWKKPGGGGPSMNVAREYVAADKLAARTPRKSKRGR